MKIIFTSCIRYEAYKKQPEWDLISDQNPDYLFLLGDNIYMDYGIIGCERIGSPQSYPVEKFKRKMTEKYQNQFTKVPEFKNLIEKMRAKNGFFAIWDDHDFGWNNAKGAHMPQENKDISRALFHQYLNCSTNLPHTYYHIDTPLARVIFIDNRSDCEEGKEGRLLDDKQFEFIRNKLQHNLKYTILCGGITLTEAGENWSKYPGQLKKLCEMTAGIDNVIFLGGDIHKNRCIAPRRFHDLNITTPIQLISSGMYINYIGIGMGLEFCSRHNWCMLEFEADGVKVNFHNKDGWEKEKSEKATIALNEYLSM